MFLSNAVNSSEDLRIIDLKIRIYNLSFLFVASISIKEKLWQSLLKS